MPVLLGIDTGGTYTDAVLIGKKGEVIAESKALTTPHNLAEGIEEALKALPAEYLPQVRLVGLSTTLATNAIVEGKGAPVCLILIGYDRELIERYEFWGELVTSDVVFIRGGHTLEGKEKEPLDIESARQAILERRDKVGAFAISGYFGVRNPAHEIRVKELVRELTGLPSTCGHELTAQLDSIRRATTAALNARLIPILQELIQEVQKTLAHLGVQAPLMVVKGDGSLMRADMALERPVETVLSGPAASAVGAYYLSGLTKALAVDMGGTTTDIVLLEDGRPRLNSEGARIGRWRTMVRAVDVHTVGLGGDSWVRVNREGRILIGPRRVIPLSYLASLHPSVLPELQKQLSEKAIEGAGEFLLLRKRAPAGYATGTEREVLRALEAGPVSRIALKELLPGGFFVDQAIERLEAEHVIMRAGFTPTDALHVLDGFRPWSAEAAEAGAKLLARLAGISPELFCREVVEGVSNRAVEAIVAKLLDDEEGVSSWPDSLGSEALLRRALGEAQDSNLECTLTLKAPIVAIGAPVRAYMPQVARKLHTELIVPPHWSVANAVGAVVGSVVQVVEALIIPVDGGLVHRLHLGTEIIDFGDLEKAVAYAKEKGTALAREKAILAGASEVEVRVERRDHRPRVAAGWGMSVYLGTELRFIATGRPGVWRDSG